MIQMLMEPKLELVCHGVYGESVDSGIGTACGEQSRFPADQGRQATDGVHQPVCQNIGTGFGEQVYIILLLPAVGIGFGDGIGSLVVQTRQSGPLGAFVQTDAAQTVDDPALGGEQVQVAGSAHQFAHQLLLNGEAHFVGAVKGEHGAALHGDLLHLCQSCAG